MDPDQWHLLLGVWALALLLGVLLFLAGLDLAALARRLVDRRPDPPE